jgi:VRR-NUC domain
MTEYQTQCQIVNYLDNLQKEGKVDCFSSIPNSTYTKSWNQKIKNKKSGLRSGLPDLFILIKGKVYFIEMKTEIGVLQPNQKKWIKLLNQKEIIAFVACSLEEVKLILKDIWEENETKNSKYLTQNFKGAKILKKLLTNY